MTRQSEAIAAANAAGRSGLMLYAIPGFPSADAYQRILELLNDRAEVSIIETTLPVHGNLSAYANETIAAAHRVAHANLQGLTPESALAGIEKPSVFVLYQETHEALGLEGLMTRSGDALDALLYEWSYQGSAEERALLGRHGVELIACIHPAMSDERMQAELSAAGPEPLIYYVSAAKTGAALYERAELERGLERTRAIRPDAKIVAGFGISTPDHVRALGALTGLDGVIIGTAFLKACAEGLPAVRAFLDAIAPALERGGVRR